MRSYRSKFTSPSGSFTTNSLMKVETLRFETTSHSHSLDAEDRLQA